MLSLNRKPIYSVGKEYGDIKIRLPFIRISLATQKNISGTYTKYIELPFFFYGRSYMGVQLKLFGISVYNNSTNG